jgi:hypothetical protein
VSAARKTTGRLPGNRRLRASDRHGRAHGDIKQHGAEVNGVVER